MSFYMQRHVEREILSALIDGELSADERRMVHEHLQTCAACREAADEFGHIHGLVTELPRLVAPESFVSEALRPQRARVSGTIAKAALGGRRRWVVLGAAAAALGITLAGLATPPVASQPPVDAFIERHVSVHSDVEPGAQVLFSVNPRR